jgi:glycosyltransferase involved in cell wall biosynthesis
MPTEEPKFAQELRIQLAGFVSSFLEVNNRCDTFQLRRIHFASRRWSRYIDKDWYGTLGDVVMGAISCDRSIEKCFTTNEIGTPRNNTLYLICLHQLEGELLDVRRIRSETNSLVVGWFWDNHHNFTLNSVLAENVDICVPSHYQGMGFLKFANPSTTRPLPLCCAQWSSTTIDQILKNNPLSNDRSTLITGRFTEWFSTDKQWDVGTRRRDIVRTYGNGNLSEYILLELESQEDYPYFSLSTADRFADWCKDRFSLCLPVRRDLSLRFFDAIVTGQIPIVDQELAGAALDDLSPSLTEGRDYILTDVSSPKEVLNARELALNNVLLHDREHASMRVRNNHLLVHRVCLLAKACIEGMQQRQMDQVNRKNQFIIDEVASKLALSLSALQKGEDQVAVKTIDQMLQMINPFKGEHQNYEKWIELLSTIVDKVSIGTQADTKILGELCWLGVSLIDLIMKPSLNEDITKILNEVYQTISYKGASFWQDLAHMPNGEHHEARRRAIELLFRLLNTGYKREWVSSNLQNLLMSDLKDSKSMPSSMKARLQLLDKWYSTIKVEPDYSNDFEIAFQHAKLLAAERLLISVIIPFHGNVIELQDAISSLLSQTYQEFEVILVVDGCVLADDVLSELRAISVPTSLTHLNQKQGAFVARRVGASKAKGSYLWFFDHDDSVEPQFLEVMLRRAYQTLADIVECPLCIYPPPNEGSPPYTFQRFSGASTRVDQEIITGFMHGYSHNNLANKLICQKLWSKSNRLLDKLGCNKEVKLIYYEDMLCTVALYVNAQVYASTTETEYNYVQRTNSSMKSTDPAHINDCWESLEFILIQVKKLLEEGSGIEEFDLFRVREVTWAIEDLLTRGNNTLPGEGWERVGRIMELFT